MPKDLLKTTTKIIPYKDALSYVHKQGQMSTDTIAQAIVLAGLSAVVMYFSKGFAPVLVEALGLAGIAATVGSVVGELTNSYNKKLGDALKTIKTNQKLKIVTKTYQNYSGSGNSTWRSNEYTITAIN